MATITEHEGIFKVVDTNGNVKILYPDVKTDKSLSAVDKPADAAAVDSRFTEIEQTVETKFGELDQVIAENLIGGVIELSQAEYDEITASDAIKEDVAYFITDGLPDDTFRYNAKHIAYDNAESGFVSGNVQDVVDEIKTEVGVLSGLNTTNKTDLVTAINEVFQSASDGKQAIIDALAHHEIDATTDDSFSSLAAKIKEMLMGNIYGTTDSISMNFHADLYISANNTGTFSYESASPTTSKLNTMTFSAGGILMNAKVSKIALSVMVAISVPNSEHGTGVGYTAVVRVYRNGKLEASSSNLTGYSYEGGGTNHYVDLSVSNLEASDIIKIAAYANGGQIRINESSLTAIATV